MHVDAYSGSMESEANVVFCTFTAAYKGHLLFAWPLRRVLEDCRAPSWCGALGLRQELLLLSFQQARHMAEGSRGSYARGTQCL